MAGINLNLDGLSNSLNKAVTDSSAAPGTAGSSDALASSLSKAILGWIQTSVYSVVITVLLLVVILFIFYGSFLYFTAYGDENRATMAKKTLTYAFVGLAVALLALSISWYVRSILIRSDYVNPTMPTVNVQQNGQGTASENPGEFLINTGRISD